MDSGRISIPIRVVRTNDNQSAVPLAQARAAQPDDNRRNDNLESESKEEWPIEVTEPGEDVAETEASAREKGYWRERALRLQAEMENYRKRQQRLAQDEIAADRERLLRAFLRVVDDLERALRPVLWSGTGSTAFEAVATPAGRDAALRQGIELTHRAALQLLQNEGVERVAAEGQPFDPNWHEAVATVSRNEGKGMAHTVVQVMEPGYRLGDQLLRPARVVVAV
jgi:molecular chaperone GrpE